MILDKRIYYKPFEYPEAQEFIDMINTTFWLHSEVNFDSDLHDYKTAMADKEREAIRRSLKAISQIEVNVKKYWGNLYNFFPKPEFEGLGATFAESEWRHSEAYSRLLDVIGIEPAEFEEFCQLPVIQTRIKYLTSVNQSLISDPFTLCKSLAIFTIAVENASLFSQFAVILSFQRFKGLMKNVADQISWTSKDENVHANAGIWLIQKLIEEYKIDTHELRRELEPILSSCLQSEYDIIDFIFEKGELEHLSKNDLKQFIKYRINDATRQAGLGVFFDSGQNLVWFDEIVFGPNQKDFFVGRPSDYSVSNVAYSENDLF